MSDLTGTAVTFQDATGAQRDALVLHVFPHCEQTELPDPIKVNLVTVDPGSLPLGPMGRLTVVHESVPHRDSAGAGEPCWWKEPA